MWQYEKRLEYPVNIKQTDPKTAQYILSQYGGPDGETNASFSMPLAAKASGVGRPIEPIAMIKKPHTAIIIPIPILRGAEGSFPFLAR